MSFALLFPGQGSQYAGFLHALPDVPVVRETLRESSDFLGESVPALDTEEAVRSTVSTQIALVVAGVAFARFLTAEHLTPSAVAGMSVGAFAAAVTAGCLSLQDALRLVKRRAELMETTCRSGEYGMAVLEGLQLPQVRKLLAGTELSIANYNARSQFVIAGRRIDLEALLAPAREAGAHGAKLLRMAVASHTGLLLPAARELSEYARDAVLLTPRMPVFSNRTARPLATADAVREDLIFNMAHAVHWDDIVTAIAANGVSLLVEAPPGRTLTQLAATIVPETRALAADGARWDVIARDVRST